MLAERYEKVKESIAEACRACGRDPSEVVLVAVSKTRTEEEIKELYDLGQRDFGENYVQELVRKAEALPKDIRWHMIGHLQKNKVKYIAPFIYMIHSVDSEALALKIGAEAVKHGRTVPVLAEVNVAGEESKFGVAPEEANALALKMSGIEGILFSGYMTSAPYVEDPLDDAPVFRKLRELSVDSPLKNIDNCSRCILSMGMSNDYKVAISEGSTMVRVGTDIFGARNYA